MKVKFPISKKRVNKSHRKDIVHHNIAKVKFPISEKRVNKSHRKDIVHQNIIKEESREI